MATMNTSDTLSVDPGRTTLGALHPEMATQFLRKKIISRPYSKSGRKNTLDFIFASAAPVDPAASALPFYSCGSHSPQS